VYKSPIDKWLPGDPFLGWLLLAAGLLPVAYVGFFCVAGAIYDMSGMSFHGGVAAVFGEWVFYGICSGFWLGKSAFLLTVGIGVSAAGFVYWIGPGHGDKAFHCFLAHLAIWIAMMVCLFIEERKVACGASGLSSSNIGSTGFSTGTWCSMLTYMQQGISFNQDKVDETVSKAIKYLAKIIFPAGNSELVTLGFGLTNWFVRMGVAKFASQELCAVNPSMGMEAIHAEAQKIMSSIAGSDHGQIFTSETPKMKTTSCIPYPIKGAIFCSTLGHSHRVAPAFAEHNFARLRDRDVELTWTKLAQNKAMQRLMGHSGVCAHSIQDALCLDAYPMCDEADLTPCMMACRNTVECFDEVFRKQGPNQPYLQKEDELMRDYTRKCQRMCKAGTGLNQRLNMTKLIGRIW